MESDADDKQRLLSRNNELQLKVDDLESLLDYEQHERKKLMTRMEEQKAMIENIRKMCDNSVPYEDFKVLSEELEKTKTHYEKARQKVGELKAEMKTETERNAYLNEKLMAREDELNKLRMSSDNYRSKLDGQNKELDKLCQEVQNVEELKYDLETERAENAKLIEEIMRFNKEILNESNVSVDDPNQSFRMMNNRSFGVGGAMPCMESVADIKINEMHSTIEMKSKEIEDLNVSVAQLKKDVLEKQQKIDELIPLEEELLEEKKKVQKAIEELTAIRLSFDIEVKDKQLVLEIKAKEIEELSYLVTRLESDALVKQQEIDESQSYIKHLEEELSQEKKNVLKANEELSESQATFDLKVNEKQSALNLKLKEFEELNNLLSNLKTSSEEKQQKIDEFESKVKTLQEELSQEKKNVLEANNLLSNLRTSSEEKQQTIEEFESKVKTLQDELSQEKKNVLKANEELSESQAAFDLKVNEKQLALDLKSKEIEDLNVFVAQLEKDVLEKQQKIDELIPLEEELLEEKKKVQKAIEELTAIRLSFDIEVKEKQSALEIKTKEIEELSDLVTRFQSDALAKQQIIDEFESKVKKLEDKLSQEKKNVLEANNLLSNLKTSSEEKQQKIDEFGSKVKTLQEELSQEKENVLKANEELSESQAVFELNVNEKQLALDLKSKEIEDFNVFVAQLENDVLEKQQKVDELIPLKEELLDAQKRLEKANEELIAIRSSLGNEVKVKQSALDLKSKEFEELNNLFSNLKTSSEEKQQKIDEFGSKVKTLEEELSQEKKNVLEANSTIEMKSNEIEKLNNLLSSLRTSSEREQQKICEFENKVKTLEEELSQEKKIVLKANEEICQNRMTFEINVNEKQSIIDMKTEEIDGLSDLVSQLKSDVIEKQQKIDKLMPLEEELLEEKKIVLIANKEFTAFRSLLDNEVKEKQSALESKSKEFEELNNLFSNLKTSSEEKQQTIEEFESKVKKLQEELSQEKKNVLKANEELSEIQAVVDKRFKSLKDNMTAYKNNLIEEQQKRSKAEKELKAIQSQSLEVDKISKDYEKQISQLRTRLNTEEMSFDMERKHKERYAAENEQYVRQIKFLEDQIRRYKELLDVAKDDMNHRNVNVCMPTTVNISTNQPNHTNFSISSMDITNQNGSNISFNISRRLPSGTGSRLAMADEEGEFMDPNHLNALKRGECNVEPIDEQRLSTLQRRNTMVLPHLRSSYGVELPFMKDCVTPETIKQGFSLHDSKSTLRQIQNINYHQNQVAADRRTGSVSLNNISINANKSKRGDIENVKITSSRMSLKSMTPTKIYRKVVKPKTTWTPNKK